MTIAEWNLVLNAALLVLIVGYGFWLRRIVNEQIRAKDSTIQSLGAAITANQAEISRLKGESAPAIARDYKIMRAHAEQMTSDMMTLRRRVDSAEQTTSDMMILRRRVDLLILTNSYMDALKPARKLFFEQDGLWIAFHILDDAWVPFLTQPPESVEGLVDMMNALWKATARLVDEVEARNTKADEYLKAAIPADKLKELLTAVDAEVARAAETNNKNP